MLVFYCTDTNLGFSNLEDNREKESMIKKWNKVKRYRNRLYEKIIKSNFIKSANSFVKTWINLDGIMLSEITYTGTDKYFMISFT